MKLSEAIKEKGKPFIVPNCPRRELAPFFKELCFKVGAEVGVYMGKFTERFLKEGIKMYAIDPWIPYVGTGRSFRQPAMQDKVYEEAKKTLTPYENCVIVKKTSMEAIGDFKNESLDFVYLDGDHRFRYIAEDLAEWVRKVRKGGIVAGHDYHNTRPGARNVMCQVKAVLDAYLEAFGIENFYLLGGVRGEDSYDKYYSWFFIKQ